MKHEIEPEKMIDTSRPSELTEAQQRLLNSLHLEPSKNPKSVGSGTAKSQAPEAKDLPTTKIATKTK